jgi:WD repeat-containing protein mio
MDTKSNIKILAEDGIAADGSALLRLWSWVERVESLCAESWQEEISWEGWNWPAKSLIEAGAIELLRMDTAGGGAGSHGASTVDKAEFCDALSCTTYHSPGRRAAMTSCGWAGKFDLTNVLGECEGLGEYERSAALAVWHADIGAAVEALQRGAAAIRAKTNSNNVQCAETLELVALCIAGYRGGDLNSSSSSIWRRACANLMQRSDLSVKNQSRVAYMTGMLKFLMSLGSDTGYQEVLFDQSLSLCDRAAFACRFLERDKLQQFLAKCITDCQSSGNIEGVTITGIEKEGMKILQSYVDRYADVQTASLITSRIILPQSWIDERRTSAEWLGAYRGLLNTWQMWQSRAMFDVDRAELLRQVKARQLAAENASGGGRTGRRPYAPPPGRKLSRQQPFDPDVQAAVPAQIDARCNYCSAPLGLRQKDNTEASQWLSKMKPVLSCCAQCRKPLPRCSICMLSLGTLNPYMELTKERSRQPRSASGRQSPDDYLSTMTNLPFAEVRRLSPLRNWGLMRIETAQQGPNVLTHHLFFLQHFHFEYCYTVAILVLEMSSCWTHAPLGGMVCQARCLPRERVQLPLPV